MSALVRFVAALPWLITGDVCREVGFVVAGTPRRAAR